MFNGRRYDSETALYYYRARYYSPGTGRFLQTDPIGYHDGLNLYTYCGNNPLNWIDPWGLDWYPPRWAADWIVEPIGDAAGAISDGGMWIKKKTDGIRGPVGVTIGTTGGALVTCAVCSSNPPGWVLGAGLVMAEVGSILKISDMDIWGTAEKVVAPIKELQQKREKRIDEILGDSDKECP